MQAEQAYSTGQSTAHEGFDSSTSYFCKSPANDNKRNELTYRIEQEIEKEIQPPLKDISYGFAQGLTETLYNSIESEAFPTRRQSLEYFDSSFMQKGIIKAKGNITQYVRDSFGITDPAEINKKRRNIYRQIEKHGLGDIVNAARPWKQDTYLDDIIDKKQYIPADKVESTLASTLAGYKEKIHPNLYESLTSRIKEKAPAIAQNISSYMPTPANRIKEIIKSTDGITSYHEARSAFEKQIIYDAMSAAGFDKDKAARYLGDSLRTLNRRISDLGIDEIVNEKAREAQPNEKRIDEVVHRQSKEDRPKAAFSEIERFHQLVREYNAKRDAERERKNKKIRLEDKNPDELFLAA